MPCPNSTVDTITSPPEFETELPKQINITKGQRLDLSCGASGTPTPEVSWYVNNAAERTGAAGIGHQTLVIDPVDGPLGVVCVANNSAGAIFAPVRVTILEEPEGEPATKKLKAIRDGRQSSETEEMVKTSTSDENLQKKMFAVSYFLFNLNFF